MEQQKCGAMQEAVMVSEVSSVSVMKDKQAVFVHHKGLLNDATITKVLEEQETETPFLYNARDCRKSNVTTYGDVLGFIQGGPGDLRRLGVESGDVVAYCSPPGKITGSQTNFICPLSIISKY